MSKQRSCAELCEAVGLYIDKCDISRCKGRIGNVKLPSETVEPVLLPTRHHLTTLVINEVHAKVMDGGVGLTLTSIRDNYCIPRVREVVKSFIRRCVVCTKYAGKPFPLIAPPNLPECRVDDSLPWTNTGVDFAGPIHVKKTNAICKESTEVYLRLLTCASMRGVHLELVESCFAEQFLLAFRRFVGSRGLPHVTMSDNAKIISEFNARLS